MLNIFNPKIVQFHNKTYAIRKWTLFGYRYLDLKCEGKWWGRESMWFKDCLTVDLNKVLEELEFKRSYGDTI